MGGFNTQLFNPDQTGTSSATLNSDLIYAALRKAGVQIIPSRGPAKEQIKDALAEENRMIGGWNIHPLMILGERIDLYNTIPGQQSYTIGRDPSGQKTADWDGDRPQRIIRANLLLSSAATAVIVSGDPGSGELNTQEFNSQEFNDPGTEGTPDTFTILPADPIQRIRRPLAIWDARQWASIQYQAVYTYPEGLYPLFNDPQQTPFMRIYFRPIPDAVYPIELITWQKIPRFLSANDAVLLEDGYEDAIVNNLAVRLSTYPWAFQRPMDPQVRVDAQTSLALIMQAHATPPRLKTDGELRGGSGFYNWKTGLCE